MAIKDILVHLDAGDTCNECMQAAVALAKRKNAHLVGVSFALESSLLQYYGEKIAPDLISSHQSTLREAAEAAIAKLSAMASEKDVDFDGRIVDATMMDLADKFAFEARHTDITFLEQPNPDRKNKQVLSMLMDGAIFKSGRPVYIVPYIGRRELEIRKAVIAWDGSHKSARAVNDAIPLLQERGETTILVIDPEKRSGAHGANPGADIAAHLARHDVKTSIDVRPSNGMDLGTYILNYLSDSGADLLVMGGYGHSRARERAFGGVTRTILEQMTVPVLMSN